MKELELTEGRGTGIPKIQRAMRANGSPPAEFKTNDDRTFFTIVLRMHPEAKNKTTPHHVTPPCERQREGLIKVLSHAAESR
ncbi:MAG: hypothetical protein J2P21_22800 [Chloracidobacterium sp.]|nr:hypothetical protein [Chloracidobacterium sp.]